MRLLKPTQEELTEAFAKKQRLHRTYTVSPAGQVIFDRLAAEGTVKAVFADIDEATAMYPVLFRNSRMRQMGYEFTRQGAVIYGRKVEE